MSEGTHSKRAVWLTVAACAAAGAVGTPVVMHFMKDTPHRLATPATLAGFSLDTGPSARGTADYLRTAVAAGLALEQPIGAVYTDGEGDSHSVIVVGGRSTSGTVDARLSALFALITDTADGVTGLTSVPTGPYGGTEKCGLSTDTAAPAAAERPAGNGVGGDMAVCGWADDSTVGMALFPNRSVADATALIARIRPRLESEK